MCSLLLNSLRQSRVDNVHFHVIIRAHRSCLGLILNNKIGVADLVKIGTWIEYNFCSNLNVCLQS